MRRTKTKPSGIEEAYAQHAGSLTRFLHRFLDSPEEIEDVLQDAFLKTYEAERKTHIDTPSAFLYKTARNLALNVISLRRRRRTEPVADVDEISFLYDLQQISDLDPEAQNLIELARDNNAVLQVGHIERFNSVMIDIDDLLDEPKFIESTRLAPFTPRATDVSVILDLMIHDIDIILDLIDSPIHHISASGISVLSDEIDIANARLEFESGCVANVTASRISRKRERKLRIFQKDAYISADFQEKILAVNRKGTEQTENGFHDITHSEKTYQDTDALNLEVVDFINAIKTGTRPKVNGEDGKRALETAISITKLIKG